MLSVMKEVSGRVVFADPAAGPYSMLYSCIPRRHQPFFKPHGKQLFTPTAILEPCSNQIDTLSNSFTTRRVKRNLVSHGFERPNEEQPRASDHCRSPGAAELCRCSM